MVSGTFFFAVLLTGVAVEEDAGVDLEPHPFRVDCNDPVLVTLTLRSHYILFHTCPPFGWIGLSGGDISPDII